MTYHPTITSSRIPGENQLAIFRHSLAVERGKPLEIFLIPGAINPLIIFFSEIKIRKSDCENKKSSH
jgi:hypothetical protein